MDVLDPVALADVPLERIESEITELAAHLAATEARWLLLIGEFDRREAYLQWGCRSTAHWLNWRCGLSLKAGYERVRVAKRFSELPETRRAFSQGRLSYSKVRAISRVATEQTEADLVSLALHATAADLERIVAGVSESTPDESEDAAPPWKATFFEDRDGNEVLLAKLPPEQMAVLKQGLRAMLDELAAESFVDDDPDMSSAEDNTEDSSAEDSSTDPQRSYPERLAEALSRMAAVALSATEAEYSSSDRFLINLHFDIDTLLGDDGGISEIEGGAMLTSDTAEYLACDGVCVPVLDKAGTPFDLGRKARVVPRRLRRAVKARDRHCVFPGCTEARFVDCHHVTYWSRGGPTALWNLALLCSFHHRMIHVRGFVMEGGSGEFSFFRPDGTEIPTVPDDDGARGPDLAVRNAQLGLEIDPNTAVPDWDGTILGRWELADAVEGLVRRGARRWN